MSNNCCPINYISKEYNDNQTKIMEVPKKYLSAKQIHQLEEEKNKNSKKNQNYHSTLKVNSNFANDIKNPNNMDDRNVNVMMFRNTNNSMKNNNMNNNMLNSNNNPPNNMNNNNFNNIINNNFPINNIANNIDINGFNNMINNNFPINNRANNIDINNFNNLNNVPITSMSMNTNMNINSNNNMNNNMNNMNISMSNNIINNNSMNNYNTDYINVTFRVTGYDFPPISFNCSINLPLKNIIWEYMKRKQNCNNPKKLKMDGNEITNLDLTLKDLGKSGGQSITIFVIYNNYNN